MVTARDPTQTDRRNMSGEEFKTLIRWMLAGLEKRLEDIKEAALIKKL